MSIDPFRDFSRAVPSSRCRPSDRCEVCRRRLAQLRQEFIATVHRSWSPAEVDTLRKAARSALL